MHLNTWTIYKKIFESIKSTSKLLVEKIVRVKKDIRQISAQNIIKNKLKTQVGLSQTGKISRSGVDVISGIINEGKERKKAPNSVACGGSVRV